MRLLLIRHAESKHYQLKVVTGWTICRGLTDNGFRQAQRLAERFGTTGEVDDCTVILSSPLQRARQTAQAILQALPIKSIEETTDLCELNPGAAEGLTREEYQKQYGDFDLVSEPTRPFAPWGESWSGFLERVRSTHERLAERFAGQTVVAVTHAGFIVASMLVMLAMNTPAQRAWLEPSHTGITEWQHDNGKWTLIRYNDRIYHKEKI